MKRGGKLAGRTIIVTGATRGIGRGIAMGLAAEGARVVAAGRDSKAGAGLTAAIRREHGGEAVFVAGDLRRTSHCRRLVERALARFGRVDGLVNNAGIFPRALLEETSGRLFDDVFETNIKAAFFCTAAVVRHMLQRGGGGSIVNIGSTHAYAGLDELAAYACSKGALLSLTRHVAYAYADRRIRCNWVTVGWVVTDGEREVRRREGRLEALERLADQWMPAGEFQSESDIAGACVYLLSDEARHVTGTELHVTGGFVPARHNPPGAESEQRTLFYRGRCGPPRRQSERTRRS